MECVKCKDEEGSSLERRLEAHPVCVWCVCVWCDVSAVKACSVQLKVVWLFL